MFIEVVEPAGRKHLINVTEIARVSASSRNAYACWLQLKNYQPGDEIEIAGTVENLQAKIDAALLRKANEM